MKENVFAADKELLDALLKRSTRIKCMHDSILFSQGQESSGLYILVTGEVMLMMRGGQVMQPSACEQTLVLCWEFPHFAAMYRTP
jgi:hypothetical protein